MRISLLFYLEFFFLRFSCVKMKLNIACFLPPAAPSSAGSSGGASGGPSGGASSALPPRAGEAFFTRFARLNYLAPISREMEPTDSLTL